MPYFADKVCCLSTDGIRCLRRIDIQSHGPKGQYAVYQLEITYKGATHFIEYGDLKELRDDMYWLIVKKLTLPPVRTKKVRSKNIGEIQDDISRNLLFDNETVIESASE